jgi:hypothetical protein
MYIRVNLHTKRCLATFASQTYNILFLETKGTLDIISNLEKDGK